VKIYNPIANFDLNLNLLHDGLKRSL